MALFYFLLPLIIFALVIIAPYFIILGGFKLLRISGISRSKIFGYVIIYVIIFFLVDSFFHSLVGLNPESDRLVIYSINNLIYLIVNFLLLRYYFQLLDKKLWQFFLYLIITGLILSVLISLPAILQYSGGPEKAKLPGEEITKNETAYWQTYKNEEHGFNIKYPQGWETESLATKEIRIKNPVSGSYFTIIENKNEKKLTLDEWFKETTIVNGRPTLKAAAQPITINGVKAYKLDSELGSPNPLFEIVGIANEQKKIFSIHAYSGTTDDNNTLNQMLSTFRFLE